MIKNGNGSVSGQLDKKLKYGDYTTLGIVLGCTPVAAKKRFLRGNKKAIEVLSAILESREQLIKRFSDEG